MSHTPGPWRAITISTKTYGSPEHGWAVIADEPMRGRIDSALTGMRLDDAKLIAAAPDLLEALKNIENDDGRIPATIWKMRNDAIAKAEGK